MVRRWPPLLWPLMSLASLFILMGGSAKVDPGLLVAGWALATLVLVLSVYLALAPWPGHPRTRALNRAIAGTTLFYVGTAAAAATAGPEYAVAGLAAGVIPLSAVALSVATTRAKTLTAGGSPADASGDAHDDPYPGVGVDDATPLGDTPEHSDADAEETWVERQPWRRARTRPR